MLCPVCKIDLIISDRQGVEIDYCPQCCGVWLDRGELDKIIERAMPTAAPAPALRRDDRRDDRRFGDDDDYRYSDESYKKKKRSSFLGDLFDF